MAAKLINIILVVLLYSQYTGSVPVVISSQGDLTIHNTNTPSLTTQQNTSHSYHLIGILLQQLNSTILSAQKVQCVYLC